MRFHTNTNIEHYTIIYTYKNKKIGRVLVLYNVLE